MSMDKTIKDQANFIVDKNSTVRAAAKVFGVSKSTIYLNVTKRLKKTDPLLYAKVRKVLDNNKEERAKRGGNATREKYRKLRELKET